MKKIMMLATALIMSAGMAIAANNGDGCCKEGEKCTKACMEMCEKNGCKDGKCTKACKKACKAEGNKDCKKGKCCKGEMG